MNLDNFSKCLARQAQYRLRNYDKALELAVELENIALENGDLVCLEQALFLKGEALEKVGRFEDAKRVLIDAARLAAGHDKSNELLLDIYECQGKASYAIGEMGAALEYWSLCLELALERQSIVHYIKAYIGIGGVYLYFGVYEESLRHHLVALEYAREIDDAVLLMMVNLWLGSDYNQLGRYELALEHLGQARAFYQRQADAGQVSEVIMHMGFACLGLNDFDGANRNLRESIAISERHHHSWPLAMANIGLAELSLKQGNANEALSFAKIAYDYAIEHHSIHHELRACRVKSAAHEALEQYEDALNAYERHCELSIQLALERTKTQLESATLRKISRSEIRLKLLKAEQQRKNLQEENIRHQAEYLAERTSLMAVNQAKNEFLALISHEIRTPLSGVIGMLRLAKGQKELRASTREQIGTGLENAELLLEIINDILDASKIEAGKVSIEQIPFDLHKLIRQVASLLSVRAEEKGLAFIVDLEHLPHEGYLGDPTRIRQVLLNLIGNAIKFTEQGSVALSVYRDGEQIKFSIADTGIGMNEQNLGRLFHKFEQADTSTTRKYGGTGLGLSICHSLVGLMQGSIGVTSQLGEGTCFRVELPLEPVQLPEEATAIQEELPALPYQIKILYAEDIITNQLIVGALLEEMGLSLQVANTGVAALECLARESFDLVLMDGRMPVMDGLMATRLIRQGGNEAIKILDPATYVVALTANATEQEKEAGFAAGMNDYLIKPIDPAQLRQVIVDATQYQLERGRELQPLVPSEQKHKLPLSDEDTLWLQQLSRAGVEVNEALNRLNGNIQRFRRWLLQFFTEQASFFAELELLLTQQQVSILIAKVHALRGVAGTLGLAALYEAASILEQNLNYCQRHGGAFPDAARLYHAWEQAQQNIWPLIKTMDEEPSAAVTLSDLPPLPPHLHASALDFIAALECNSLRARSKWQALLIQLPAEVVSNSGVSDALDKLDYPAALSAIKRMLPENFKHG